MSYRGVRLSSSLQFSSSVQVSSSELTTHDLQLRKVISPSFELRLGCSWTLWKAHGVKNILVDCLIRFAFILVLEIMKNSRHCMVSIVIYAYNEI